jgi:Ammonia permease
VANKCGEWGSIGGQVWIQFQGVLVTLVWSGVVAFIAYKIVDLVIGLRVPEDESAKAWTSRPTARPPTANSPSG